MGPNNGRNNIEEVRAATNIVDVVSGYLPLKKAGASFVACCPFHREKTPSFHVSAVRQTFHCFGCHEGGTVFDFVMKMDRIEFPEALRVLADRAGVQIDRSGAGEDRSLLLKAHECAQELYLSTLRSAAGSETRGYIEKRGIRPQVAQEWGLGMAPDGWEGLITAARSRGIDGATLERSGLALAGTTRPGHYDRFRGRLTFPIRDSFGRIVAFGARSLDGSEPKYLNSPETPVFSKGRMLYGLDRLRHHVRSTPVLVMEGYTDVIMSTQAGVPGCVATLGTAMTAAHAKILARYTDHIVLVYDGDKAGLAAAERGARLLLEGGHLDIRVAVLPDGEDPADYFLRCGEAGVAPLMELTVPLINFLLDRTLTRHDVTQVPGRMKAAHELAAVASAIPDAIARELTLQAIADRVGVSVQALGERVQIKGGAETERPAPAAQSAPGLPRSLTGTASLWLVQAALNDPAFAARLDPGQIALVPSELARSMLTHMVALAQMPGSNTASLLDGLEVAEERALARRALLPEEHGHDLARMGTDALEALGRQAGRGEVRRLQDRLAEDPGALAELSRRYRATKSQQAGPETGQGS